MIYRVLDEAGCTKFVATTRKLAEERVAKLEKMFQQKMTVVEDANNSILKAAASMPRVKGG